jgi:RHS repeat-associated protein
MIHSVSPPEEGAITPHPSSCHPCWMRRGAFAISVLFAWTMILATPAAALAHQPPLSRPGVRTLTPQEMATLVGRGGGHGVSYSLASGPTYPWEGNYGDCNTGNGNKLTSVPIVGWTQRGGLPVNLTLYHNSEGNHDSELGQKWTFSYDLYLVASGTSPHYNQTVHWGNDLSYQFTNNGSDVFTAPTGIYDSFVKNVDGTFTLTTKSQVAYHFNTSGYCDTISDENGNSLSIAHNSGNYVTTITDATSRTITLGYDSSNRINSITDPLSRQWTISYDSSNQLQTLTYPVVNVAGTPTTYTATFGYDSNHNITDQKTPNGNHWTFNYNSVDNSLNWQEDPAGHQTGFSYTSGKTVITDPNSHTRSDFYGSGTLTQQADALSNTVSYLYDSNLNKKQITDARGKVWNYTFDSSGNRLTAEDPLLNTTTFTYNAHNNVLTVTIPTGEETEYGYDSHDNLTSLERLNSSATVEATETYTVNSYGLRTDYYDANSHHYQYGYSTNGDLTNVTTPLGNQTQWAYNALGVKTSRTDALSRTTTYTPDAWERLVTITYPDSSTKSFNFDGDNNLTSFTDATGTISRSYDAEDRLLSESKGGSTVVSHTYDATGKLGLLSTTTDANGRVITYSYTARNQLYQVSETAGTTTYSYDNNGNETGITNPNGTTVTKGYDNASQLTSVVNKNSTGTTLSSFSYMLDTDGRRHTVTEADGSVVTYGYDWGSRLTSEVRTGTNPYSKNYTLDGVGNRTAQTVGTATTSFTLDSDDQLNSTSSTTGGFTNSYSYNANGEQTGRTISGTAYTLAFDYDGELSSITQGSNVTSFAYDATGRRVSRTAGGTTTNFLYDGSHVLLEQQGTSTTATYTYGNALIRKDGETPLFDGLGSERTVTNSSQTVTGTATYEGFGQTVATTGSSTDPYMFAATSGYRNDGDAGLMQVGARYYDAQVGRFITRDTLLDQKPYLYCEHDPINHLDPSGHFIIIVIIIIVVAIGLGGCKGGGSPPPQGGGIPFNPPRPPKPPATGPTPLPPGVGPPWKPGQPLRLDTQPVPGGGEWTGTYTGPPINNQIPFEEKEPGWFDWGGTDGNFFPGEGGGGGGAGCFVAGTLVSLANGERTPIEHVRVGDLVLSRDELTGQISGQKVEKVFVHRVNDDEMLHLCNKEMIDTTSIHRFYIVGIGWLHAGQLQPGMRCVSSTGVAQTIASIDYPGEYPHTVYNLEVHRFHTYFVGKTGVWVHNMK